MRPREFRNDEYDETPLFYAAFLTRFVDGSETRELVATHLKALRELSCFTNANIVLIPEANLANEAQEISEHVLEMNGLSVVSEKKNRYGIYTTNDTKKGYVARFANLIAYNAISYHDHLVSANPFVSNLTPAERANAARREFERQLRSFRRIHVLAPSISSRPTVQYSGKVDNDKRHTSRLRDDLCLAGIFGVYWAEEYKEGLIQARGYANRFVRPNKRPLAPLVTPSKRRKTQDAELKSFQIATSGTSSTPSRKRRRS